jgi:hypothetical protein
LNEWSKEQGTVARAFVTPILLPGRIAGMNSLSTPAPEGSGERWRFLRDLIVFQLKLLLDNLRDFALVPISLVAALIDLVYKGEREGALFYKVLRWGAHSEEVIDVYSALKHHSPGSFKLNPAYTVDAVIGRLEGVVVREYEKGGTACEHQGGGGSCDRSVAPRNEGEGRPSPRCGCSRRG